MNNEADRPSLEDRLRREAQTIASRHARPGAATALVAEYRRRSRIRRVRLAGASALAAVVLAGAYFAMTWTADDAVQPPPLATSPTEESSFAERHSDTRMLEPAENPSRAEPPQLAEGPSQAHTPPLAATLPAEAVPFLITGPDGNGHAVVAVGVYIPPRVERVNLHDLPPLEQAAVRRVLNLDEEIEKPTI